MHKTIINLFLLSLLLISCAPKNIDNHVNEKNVEIMISINIWKNLMPLLNGEEEKVISIFEGSIKFIERVERVEVIFVGIYNEEEELISEIILDSTLVFITPDNFESFSIRGEAKYSSEIQANEIVVGNMTFVIDEDTLIVETEKVEVKAVH